MGAISPVSESDDEVAQQIMEKVVRPLAHVMVNRGTPFTGILYTGVMQTEKGLYVIEFNVRLGDPETQVLLPRIETDWITILLHHFAKKPLTISFSPKQSLGVVVAANGYPGTYQVGQSVAFGLIPKQMHVYFAGVIKKGNDLLSNGGRVFLVQSMADSIEQGRESVYQWLRPIDSSQFYYRTDIGKKREDD